MKRTPLAERRYQVCRSNGDSIGEVLEDDFNLSEAEAYANAYELGSGERVVILRKRNQSRVKTLMEFATHPLLVKANWRCEYCGLDLLADLDHLLAFAKDHVKSRFRGGSDGNANRAAVCAACDRIKGSRKANSIEEARRLVSQRRAELMESFDRIREQIRG